MLQWSGLGYVRPWGLWSLAGRVAGARQLVTGPHKSTQRDTAGTRLEVSQGMSKYNQKQTKRDRLIAALMAHATVTLTCEPEDLAIEGNCMASGDDKVDHEQEQWIHDQLRAGNEWAWCCAHVRVNFHGFHADNYLGACSYLSEDDFRMPGGYFDDMVREACGNLADQLIRAGVAIKMLLHTVTKKN